VRTAPLTPLQKYDISQLKLVAILSTPEGNIALVEDSTGRGYFVKRGTEIGKNDGKVTKILKDRIIIEELYSDVWGQTKKNEVYLLLHKIEEGGES
ncbi:MAG: pilus assembly protein PilP, partial [Deltaproteobacteria bacterium]|nr:pilus assembly protein PilP [Deltaproteobacteria bacterium]